MSRKTQRKNPGTKTRKLKQQLLKLFFLAGSQLTFFQSFTRTQECD